MRWTPLLSGFILNKNAFITTKRNSEPESIRHRYGIQGFDERYLIYYDNHDIANITETLIKIKKYMNQLDLLNILESPRVSIYEKIKHIDEHEKTFGHHSIAYNISSGSLWTDFNYNIEL